MAERRSLPQARRTNIARGLWSSKSYMSGMAHSTMLVYLAMLSGHISVKFAEVEV